jgi:hypothetical protein
MTRSRLAGPPRSLSTPTVSRDSLDGPASASFALEVMVMVCEPVPDEPGSRADWIRFGSDMTGSGESAK